MNHKNKFNNGLFLFVQNRPLYRGGMEISAKTKSAPLANHTYSSTFRINFRMLEKIVATGRAVERKALFGLENKKVFVHGWEIFRDSRAVVNSLSPILNHQFIQELTIDMVAKRENLVWEAHTLRSDIPCVDAFEAARRSKRVYCLVSPDRGLVDVVTSILDAGFLVEIYAWSCNCPAKFIGMSKGKYLDGLKVVFLDEFIQDIELESSKIIEDLPKHRTYVLQPYDPKIDRKEFFRHCEKLPKKFSSELPFRLLRSEKKTRAFVTYDQLKRDDKYEADLFQKVKEWFAPYGEVFTYVAFFNQAKPEKEHSMSSSQLNPFGVLGEGSNKKAIKRCWMREFCDKAPNCRLHHTDEEMELFQTNGGESPYKLVRNKAYVCPEVRDRNRVCISYTCDMSHTKNLTFCCQCSVVHKRDWREKGACINNREIVTTARAQELIQQGYVIGEWEGPFVYMHDCKKTFGVNPSEICIYREFCTWPFCTFFHTEEEKAIFEENDGISPYQDLNDVCFWCAESHEGGPTHCPMKGKIRLHPITRERANKFEEDGGLSLSLSSSVDFNSLRYSEHDPLVLRMSGDDFSSFPRCSCLEEGTFVLVDSKTDWCGMEEEAKKRFGEGGFENLKEKVLKGDEKTRGFARKKNLTQYLIEDATALIEYSALFQANGSQGREFVQAVRRSRVFSIVSGDKLLAGAIEWVVERGFRVRMYAWEESCPEVYLRFQEMYEGLFELNYLNNLFSDIKEKLPQKEESKNIPLAPPPCLPLEKKEESQKKGEETSRWTTVGEAKRKKKVQNFRDKSHSSSLRGTRHCFSREGCFHAGVGNGCKYYHTPEEMEFFKRHGSRSPYRNIIKPFCWICLGPHATTESCRRQPVRPIITEEQEESLIQKGYIRRHSVFFSQKASASSWR